MEFKHIEDRAGYLKQRYGAYDLTDKRHCLHCRQDILVRDYKVEVEDGIEYFVCPNAPECSGTVIDWVKIRK